MHKFIQIFLFMVGFLLLTSAAFNPNLPDCDVITMKDGKEIEAKVLEITVTEIKYKSCDNQDVKSMNLKNEESYVEFFLHILLPLTCGGFIYFYSRINFNAESLYRNLLTVNRTHYLPEFIKYNIVDGFWLYSFLYSIVLTWKKVINTESLLWLLLVLLIGVLSEFFQKVGILLGTFDLNDILVYIISFLSFFILNFKKFKFI